MTKPVLVLATVVYTLLGIAAFHNMPLKPKKENLFNRIVLSAFWPVPVIINGCIITFLGKAVYFGEPQP